jgi:hypothetical protein
MYQQVGGAQGEVAWVQRCVVRRALTKVRGNARLKRLSVIARRRQDRSMTHASSC